MLAITEYCRVEWHGILPDFREERRWQYLTREERRWQYLTKEERRWQYLTREERRWQYLDANVKRYVILPRLGPHFAIRDCNLEICTVYTASTKPLVGGRGGGGIKGSKKKTNL